VIIDHGVSVCRRHRGPLVEVLEDLANDLRDDVPEDA
jgi:hypothetical protein